MEKLFHLNERGTNVRTELIAGATAFMAMSYILMVNATMFSDPLGTGEAVLGVSYGAMYVATAISAVIGTLLMGFLANLPLALAPGMGLNAYFVYTVCLTLGFSYANALVMVLIDGVVFVLLTVTGLRKKIFDAIPKPVRIAVPAGIGLFVAFIGLQSAGIVVPNESTGVALASFNLLSGAVTWGDIMPMLVTFISLIAIGVLARLGKKGSVIWGILGGTALYYALGFTVPGFYEGISLVSSYNPLTAIGEFGTQTFGKVFTEGFDFSAFITANGTGAFVVTLLTTSLAFCMVDMFDTLGTLYGACARGDLLTEDGEVPKMNEAMLSDAFATTGGAILGCSTVTTYVDSTAGIAEGGKTGLTAVFAAAFFFVAMFLSPIAALIPSCATSGALIYIGVLMMNCVTDIEWTKPAAALPAFLTVIMMPFTYNVSYGIGLGVISFSLIALFSGKGKSIGVTTWVIGLLFAAMFFLTH